MPVDSGRWVLPAWATQGDMEKGKKKKEGLGREVGKKEGMGYTLNYIFCTLLTVVGYLI